MSITVSFNESELEILKAAMNRICADYISESVDIVKSEDEKAMYERLYNRSCLVRNKIYDEVFANV